MDTGTIRATEDEALQFHASGRPGKLSIAPTKPLTTQRDLSLAYSPGVAFPCLHIQRQPSAAFDYTSKGNFVAVISNGTAVLGLGDLGALAAKPVMEGKAALFKRFADIDSIDLEIDTRDVDEFVNCVRFLHPAFGGINLEDIKAPECFVIEERLRELLDIPVFHDDQHGTAIIAAAGLINALHLTGRDLDEVKMVVNGAGAASIACVELLKTMGLPPHNVVLCDTRGVIYRGRTDGMNQWKSAHAVETKARTLAEAIEGADVLLRPFGQGSGRSGDGPLDGGEADHLRDGQPRSGDHPRRGARRALRRDHRHRAVRLSQPGQQRAGVSLHLSRRPRCARLDDQRGDEDRRGRGAGPARPRGRARRGRRRLFRRAPDLRTRLHHPGAVRPAADLGGAVGRRQGGDGFRRRAQADPRHGRLPAQPARPPRPDRGRARADLRPRCGPIPSASSSPRARKKRRSAPRCYLPRAATARRFWSGARSGSSRRWRRWAWPRPRGSKSTMRACRTTTSAIPTSSTRGSSATACSTATASAR